MLIDRTGVVQDGWTFVTDGPVPDGAVILPLDRLEEAWREPALTGVHVAAGQDPMALPPMFGRVALISVEFRALPTGGAFPSGAACARSASPDGCAPRAR